MPTPRAFDFELATIFQDGTLRSLSGDSGSYLGLHLESRVRWDIVPGNVRVEGGLILLNARNLSDNNSEFLYAGATFTF